MDRGDPLQVFNPEALRCHRTRAARLGLPAEFLFERCAADLVERLGDVRRRFLVALDLGCRGGLMVRALSKYVGVERLISADPCEAMVRHVRCKAVTVDLEALPFAAQSFDVVLSPLLLHWVNDLPGILLQLRRILKPDGLLLATLFGGTTLSELQAAFMEAELEVEGGISPRISPFADLRDFGDLLQRAGFTAPVVDADRFDIDYADAFALMHDLRAMGETNIQRERRKSLSRRRTLLRAAEIYRARFAGSSGRIIATFQTINLAAWTP